MSSQACFREEPLMIWGGSGKSGEKNSTATRPGKKTQLNNPEENKNSTQQPGRKKNSRLAGTKKSQCEFSARAPPQIINGPSLMRVRSLHLFHQMYCFTQQSLNVSGTTVFYLAFYLLVLTF